MLTFNAPWKKCFENIVGKRENAGNQHLVLFSSFSTLPKKNCTVFDSLKLSSANAFNLDKGNILFSVKWSTLY